MPDQKPLGILISPPLGGADDVAYVLMADHDGSTDLEVFVGRGPSAGNALSLVAEAMEAVDAGDPDLTALLGQLGPNWWHISSHLDGHHEDADDPECMICRDESSAAPPEATLVLDPDAIDEMQPIPVGADDSPSDLGVAEIANQLTNGPVTLNGPEPHWCIQAIGSGTEDREHIHIEILDPVFWESGPALPNHQVEIALELGFEAQEGMWTYDFPVASERDIVSAAKLMLIFTEQAWQPVD